MVRCLIKYRDNFTFYMLVRAKYLVPYKYYVFLLIVVFGVVL
jgi:hypothetical protein